MKAVIGVYDTHEQAVEAVKELQKGGYKAQQLSILGQANSIDQHIHVRSGQRAEGIEVGIGATAGAVIGILTGVGVFLVPGLGFLYGAGALVGAFAGLDFGLMGGGLVAVLTQLGVDKTKAAEYEHFLKEGKFMVVVQSTQEEIDRAHKVLHTHGTHVELDAH